MAGLVKKYVLGNKRLIRSRCDGFAVEDNALVMKKTESGDHHVYLRGIDGAQEGMQWGHLSFRTTGGGDCALTVRAFASDNDCFLRRGVVVKTDDFLMDETVSDLVKEQFFEAAGGITVSGTRDVLLGALHGRRIWIWIEAIGQGELMLADLALYAPGDDFFRTFPEIYRADEDFFYRYLSVYSTMYNELQETIDHIDQYLDPDTASVAALHRFSSWLGLETEGVVTDEKTLRRVVKALPALFAVKGTKKAIEMTIALFVDDPFYVVERNLLTSRQIDGDMYGETPWDFTVLINRSPDEAMRAMLEYFISQVKPACANGKIIFFGSNSSLDFFTYLDFNGQVLENTPASLDSGGALTGMHYLQ